MTRKGVIVGFLLIMFLIAVWNFIKGDIEGVKTIGVMSALGVIIIPIMFWFQTLTRAETTEPRRFTGRALFFAVVLTAMVIFIVASATQSKFWFLGDENQQEAIALKCMEFYYSLHSEPSIQGRPKPPKLEEFSCTPEGIRAVMLVQTPEYLVGGQMTSWGEKLFSVLTMPWPADLDIQGYKTLRMFYLEQYAQNLSSRLWVSDAQLQDLVGTMLFIAVFSALLALVSPWGCSAKVIAALIAMTLYVISYFIGLPIASLGIFDIQVQGREAYSTALGIGILMMISPTILTTVVINVVKTMYVIWQPETWAAKLGASLVSSIAQGILMVPLVVIFFVLLQRQVVLDPTMSMDAVLAVASQGIFVGGGLQALWRSIFG